MRHHQPECSVRVKLVPGFIQVRYRGPFQNTSSSPHPRAGESVPGEEAVVAIGIGDRVIRPVDGKELERASYGKSIAGLSP